MSLRFTTKQAISSGHNATVVLARKCSHVALSEDYTDEPSYPPIEDVSRLAQLKKRKQLWHNKITSLPTVEQKLVEFNMPKYYGYWSCCFNNYIPSFNGVDFIKFATRTHCEHGVPWHYYEDVKDICEVLIKENDLITKLEHSVNDLLLTKVNSVCKDQRHIYGNFMLNVHRILLSAAATKSSHLSTAMVSLSPRLEAFWFVGGIQPDKMMKKTRKNCEADKDRENEPLDRPFQAKLGPFLALRVENGLPDVVSRDDPLSTLANIPCANMDPRSYGLQYRFNHATIIPGFWPGERNEHGQLFIYTRYGLDKFEKKYGAEYIPQALIQKAIVSGFAQALSFSLYQGFGPVTEVTYPFVQQLVFSDGLKWHFGLYQMNTSSLHSEGTTNNSYNNILWFSPEMELFTVGSSGKVESFNEEVIKLLLCMYLKKGIARENPAPYLAPYKYLAHHAASEEYKVEFQKQLYHLLSNRPRHIPKPEIYNWEHIYKVKFRTRPMDPLRRFFEHFNDVKHPGKMRLDDHAPPYVPKALRKHRRLYTGNFIDSEKLFRPSKII